MNRIDEIRIKDSEVGQLHVFFLACSRYVVVAVRSVSRDIAIQKIAPESTRTTFLIPSRFFPPSFLTYRSKTKESDDSFFSCMSLTSTKRRPSEDVWFQKTKRRLSGSFSPVGIDDILRSSARDEGENSSSDTEEMEEPSRKRPRSPSAIDRLIGVVGGDRAAKRAVKRRRMGRLGPEVVIRKPRLARYDSLFSKFSSIKKKEYKKRKAKWRVPRKHEYYKKNFSRGIESSGDKRIRELRGALSQLDQMGFLRSSHQREFHEAFIGACLPQIYGEDFDRNLVKILRENDLDEIRCEIMVCCPRRWGKTMAVALFSAAYLWTQPDAEIIVYSIAKRTSSMLSSKIYNMVVKLAGGTHGISVHNQEELVLTNSCGGESVLHSYPAASRISIFFYLFVHVEGGGRIFFFFIINRQTGGGKREKGKKKRKKEDGQELFQLPEADAVPVTVCVLVDVFDAHLAGVLSRQVQRRGGGDGGFFRHDTRGIRTFEIHAQGLGKDENASPEKETEASTTQEERQRRRRRRRVRTQVETSTTQEDRQRGRRRRRRRGCQRDQRRLKN